MITLIYSNKKRQLALQIGFTIAISTLVTACGHISDGFQSNATPNTIELNAVTDFTPPESEHPVKSYIDTQRQSQAINAAQFKDQSALVEHQFKHAPARYTLTLTTLLETDGESQYQISLLDKDGTSTSLSSVTNPESEVDFVPHEHQWDDITLNKDVLISISFSAETNGKIPEGDGTAYSRGRWTKLTLQCRSGCGN